MTITPNPGTDWPSSYQGCRITAQYLDMAGHPVAGFVHFKPMPTVILDHTDDVIVVGRRMSFELDEDGRIDITIPATDDPDVSPIDWTYEVKEEFVGGGGRRSFHIIAPANAIIDLADAEFDELVKPPSTGTWVPTGYTKAEVDDAIANATPVLDWSAIQDIPVINPFEHGAMELADPDAGGVERVAFAYLKVDVADADESEIRDADGNPIVKVPTEWMFNSNMDYLFGQLSNKADASALDDKADLDPDTGLVKADQLPAPPASDWDSVTDKPVINPFKHSIFLAPLPPVLGGPPGAKMPVCVNVKVDGDGDWYYSQTDGDGDQMVSVMTYSAMQVALGGLYQGIQPMVSHVTNTDNPHEVTAAQVGLDKVQNIPSPHFQKWHPGRWYGPMVAQTGSFMLANNNQRRIMVLPFWVPQVATIDQLSLEVTVAGTSGQVFRLGVYDNDPIQDIPANLLVSSADILGDTTGHKTASVTPTVLQPGWNWLATVANNGTLAARAAVGVLPPVASDAPGTASASLPYGAYIFGYETGGPADFDATAPASWSSLGKGGAGGYVMVRCQP